MHTQRAIEARGCLPIPVGLIRLDAGLPARIQVTEMGKHRPENNDRTVRFFMVEEPETIKISRVRRALLKLAVLGLAKKSLATA